MAQPRNKAGDRRRQAHLPYHSYPDQKPMPELQGSSWTPGETVHRWESQMKLFRALVLSGLILRWFLQPLSAREGCAHLKEQMMCRRCGIKGGLYSHILLAPQEYTKNYRSLKAFFPMGIYTKSQIFESSFSTNYVNIFLSNSVRGAGGKFFPTSVALECFPVTALSNHTGLFTPMLSPLNSNHYPKCSKCS